MRRIVARDRCAGFVGVPNSKELAALLLREQIRMLTWLERSLRMNWALGFVVDTGFRSRSATSFGYR